MSRHPSPFPSPLKGALREEDDELAVQRMWQEIDGRTVEEPLRRGRALRWGLGTTGLLVAAAVMLLVFVRRDAGPLRLYDGRALAALSAPAEGLTLPLSDGSVISLSGGARFEPLESTGTTFLAVLQGGRGSFDIRPGGPRRWQVECGLATVEVLGTQFTCNRAPGRLDIVVDRGVVLVRGERVPDRAQRLSAGQRMTVLAEPSAASAAVVTAPIGAGANPPERPSPVAEPVRTPDDASGEEWKTLAKRGRHKEAFAALGPQGIRRASRTLGVTGLLTLADVARLSGHPAEAVAPLERILRDFSLDAQAPLAAFELGRLQLDSLGRPLEAVLAFERGLRLGMPSSLEEDVQARLVEAYEKAGEGGKARALGAAYLREHPAGRYRRVIEARLTRTR